MIHWIDDGKGDFIMAAKCDGCGLVLERDVRDGSNFAAGWRYIRREGDAPGEDFCPRCWKLRQ